LLSGSPYSWETVLSSTTVVKSVMVTLGNTHVHLLASDKRIDAYLLTFPVDNTCLKISMGI